MSDGGWWSAVRRAHDGSVADLLVPHPNNRLGGDDDNRVRRSCRGCHLRAAAMQATTFLGQLGCYCDGVKVKGQEKYRKEQQDAYGAPPIQEAQRKSHTEHQNLIDL